MPPPKSQSHVFINSWHPKKPHLRTHAASETESDPSKPEPDPVPEPDPAPEPDPVPESATGQSQSQGPNQPEVIPPPPATSPPPKPVIMSKGGPIRTLELVRAKFDKLLEINAFRQTFYADVFFEFKIVGGALDEDLIREGDGPMSQHFPKDTLRPSARWYLNQFDFSNSVHHTVHQDTVAQVRGEDIYLRYRAFGEFAEQLELENFPFDCQELTVKLIVHTVIGGIVGVEITAPGYVDEYSGPKGIRAIPRNMYKLQDALKKEPQSLSHFDIFKVDTFHLHNVWTMCNKVYGHIEVHAHEFPQLAMTCLVRRKPDFYMHNVVITMIVLELMMLAAFAIEGATTEGEAGRISLALTLVLTCGIYRQTNAQFSPPVACLTLLDEYMLVSSLIIGGSVLVHAILALESRCYGSTEWEPFLIALLFLSCLGQHVYIVLWRVMPAAEEARALGFTDVVMPLGLTEDSNKKRISLVGLFSTAKFLSRVGPHDKAKPALDSFKSQKTVKVYSSEKGAYTYVNLEDSGAGATTA